MGKGRFRRFVGVVCIQYTQVWDRKKMKQGYWILLLTVFLLFIFSHHGFVTTWQGSCNFANCTFAHGEHELRGVSRGSTNKFEFHCRHCLSWQFICMNPGRLSSDKDFSVEVFFLGGSRFFMKRCRSLWCQSCMSGFTGNRWLQFWRNHQIWLRRRVVSHGQICKNINANQLKWYEMKSHLKPDWWNEMAADHKQSTVNVDLRHTDEVCLCSAISAFSASSFQSFQFFSGILQKSPTSTGMDFDEIFLQQIPMTCQDRAGKIDLRIMASDRFCFFMRRPRWKLQLSPKRTRCRWKSLGAWRKYDVQTKNLSANMQIKILDGE